jgi:hypothetical protein
MVVQVIPSSLPIARNRDDKRSDTVIVQAAPTVKTRVTPMGLS